MNNRNDAVFRDLRVRSICPDMEEWAVERIHEKALVDAAQEARAFMADADARFDEIEISAGPAKLRGRKFDGRFARGRQRCRRNAWRAVRGRHDGSPCPLQRLRRHGNGRSTTGLRSWNGNGRAVPTVQWCDYARVANSDALLVRGHRRGVLRNFDRRVLALLSEKKRRGVSAALSIRRAIRRGFPDPLPP